MYAIVEIAGQQFKVEKGKKIYVHRLEAEAGKNVEFEKVLLIEDDGSVMVGEPLIDGYIVEAKVLDHLKGDKVIVFKKKRKKGYRVKNGHRQNFTQVEIVGIGKKGAEKKTSETKEEAKEKTKAPKQEVKEEISAEKKPGTKKSAEKKQSESKDSVSEAQVKKPAAKKPAAKKPSAKKPAAKKPSEKKSAGTKSPEGE